MVHPVRPEWPAEIAIPQIRLTRLDGPLVSGRARFLPSHGVGIVSLIALALARFALYVRHLAGAWRRTYAVSAVSAVIALYLNAFVLIVRLFQKVPALKAMAPTRPEPRFKIAQLALLVLFVVLATSAAIRFRNEQFRSA